MSNAANYIKKWHEVILEGKMELLDNLLNDNATFYSPVVFTPLEGKEITKMYLSAAGLSFHPLGVSGGGRRRAAAGGGGRRAAGGGRRTKSLWTRTR